MASGSTRVVVGAEHEAATVPVTRVESGAADGPSATLPLWFERGLVVAVAGVVSFGGFGLLLADLGHYRMLTAFALGGAGTVLGTLLAWPRRRPRPGRRRGVVAPAIGMCVVAVAFALWNGAHAGEHVAVGRDPGVYTAAAKWVATHGTLQVPGAQSQWAAKDADVTAYTEGSYLEGDHLEFQFSHLMPVLMAEGNDLGGDGLMFLVPVLLGSLALCAVYAVGCRLVRRPWLVLAAVGALALSLPQLNVSRDTYSEAGVEFLLWAGMWLLLVAHERRRIGAALLAGMTIGGTLFGRIDAVVYLIPLPVLGALAWLAARYGDDRRPLRRTYSAVLAGVIPVAVLGTFDVRNRAGRYYADLHGQVHALQLALALSALAAVGLVVLWPRAASRAGAITGWARTRRVTIGWGLAGLVALAVLVAWTLRPLLQHPRAKSNTLVGSLQRRAGIPFDPRRLYSEDTVTWISWYLGPITVALAIVGVAILIARIARHPQAAAVLVVAAAGIGTALYLWKPSIVPDQIWASRRFVPAGLPLFVLLSAVAIDAVAVSLVARAGTRWVRPALALAAAGMLLFPLRVTEPVREFEAQAGYLTVIKSTCRVTGADAAILFVAGDRPGQQLVLPVRSWCDVPVGTLLHPATAEQLRALADRWRAAGRQLWVVGTDPGIIASDAAGVSSRPVAAVTNPHELEMTINRPPGFYAPSHVSVYAGRVTP